MAARNTIGPALARTLAEERWQVHELVQMAGGAQSFVQRYLGTDKAEAQKVAASLAAAGKTHKFTRYPGGTL